MYKNHFTIHLSKIACLICITVLAYGCNESTEAPPKAQVVSKKITVAKVQKAAPAKKEATASKPANKPQAVKPKPAAPAAATAPPTSPVKNTATPVVAPIPPPKLDPIAKAAPPATPDPSTPKTEEIAAVDPAKPAPASVEEPAKPETQSYLLTGVYNPAGKIDPFLPLYKEKPAAEEDEKKKKKKKRRLPLTPLEKVDISQLKLVGIIRAPSGNKALVQEATGKGYIVKEGTYIGIHAGRVIGILKDRLIVEEEVETALGTYELQKREMKIQKPPGEL